jgi:hypothetical protein
MTNRSGDHTLPKLAALVTALALLGGGGGALADLVRPSTPGDKALDGAGWEGRRLIAQMLWVKTHSVLHAGAEERAAKPGEEKSRGAEYHEHGDAEDKHEGEDAHAGHAHAEGEACELAGGEGGGHVLVIPPANEDFRGVLGDLERSVKPYAGADGKMFSKDSAQTIPFYRLMTWADPHYIQGYTVGATFINKVGKETDAALEFLHEGARFNPSSFEIQTELGHIYLVYKKDYAAAEKHLLRAVELVPKGKLTELEEEGRTDAYRWLALNYVQWDKPTEAVRIARYGLMLIGEDPSLNLVLTRKGMKAP